jgi:hypothetical protein
MLRSEWRRHYGAYVRWDDTEGRLTQDAGYTYIWDELGQLIEVRNKADASLVASYQYDAIGRRKAKTVGGSTVKYLHDGADPIQIQDRAGNPFEHLLAGGAHEWLARTSGADTDLCQRRAGQRAQAHRR